MIQPGDAVPQGEIRTGAGTSISLCDLRGRAVAVFLLGRAGPAFVAELLAVLTEHIQRLLALQVSPIVVLSHTDQQPGVTPLQQSAPYLVAIDPKLFLHQQFQVVESGDVGVWLIDENGVVADVIPALPPLELVRLCIKRARRARSGRDDAQ